MGGGRPSGPEASRLLFPLTGPDGKWGDIIPPFEGYPGQNFTAEGQAILANNCQIAPPPTQPTQPTQPTTPTTPTTPTQPTAAWTGSCYVSSGSGSSSGTAGLHRIAAPRTHCGSAPAERRGPSACGTPLRLPSTVRGTGREATPGSGNSDGPYGVRA